MTTQRIGSGWAFLLADLSLILFMVTAAGLTSDAEEAAALPGERSEAVAVYAADPAAPPLRQWLAQQGRDPRLILTILSPFAPGGEGEALARAAAMQREAASAGMEIRIVVEPGDPPATATLAYDSTAAALARGLQDGEPPAAGELP